MKYGISHLSIVPVRHLPGDSSEQVSQLLFGEHFTILEVREKWVCIECAHDRYRGWIDFKQFKPLTEPDYMALEASEHYFTNEAVSIAHILPDPQSADAFNSLTDPGQILVAGSILPFYSGGTCSISGSLFQVTGIPVKASVSDGGLLQYFSSIYMNCPYQWGGRSPFGIDCSGLTQLYGRFAGLKLPRDASEQALQGMKVPAINEAENGDFAFFENISGKVIHVGLIIGKNKILHASGQVRLDSLDAEGIFNHDTGLYTHKLSTLRRLVE